MRQASLFEKCQKTAICVNRIDFCSKHDSALRLPNQNPQASLPGNISLLFLYQRARQEFESPGSAVA
jgi:hypothetical protein